MIHIDLTLIVEVVLFLLFLWVLNRVFYQPISAIFQQRSARVEAGLRAAEESQRRAEETQREVQRQLDQARQEAQGLMAAAHKEADAERRTLMEQAKGEADTLLRSARQDIQRERDAAVEQVRRETGAIAILVASKAVGASMDTAANRDLAERAIAEAGGSTLTAGIRGTETGGNN